MYKPNYNNGSIVNLMSSIKKSFGGESRYQPLKNLRLAFHKNIVLIVIDGLGYEYLLKYGRASFLYKNLRGKITSVFPSTTATALTSFLTGQAPQQHGLTGWYMYLKEIGMVTMILPFVTRAGNLPLSDGIIKYQDIYGEKSFFEDLKAASFIISHQDYFNSQYSQLAARGARRLSFSDLNSFFKKISQALSSPGKQRKFVFAYWAELDSLLHKYGTTSQEAKKHFNILDGKIKFLTKSLVNTTVIVCADHGLINSEVIKIGDHPKLLDTLIVPLTGEPRVVYCYVRPEQVKRFKNYVKIKFKKYCTMHKSGDLIKRNYFGLFSPNEKLKDRVGDYVLIMKKNYILKDLITGENGHIYLGNHGGVSREEMLVPLAVID